MKRSTPAASPAFLALACVGFIASTPVRAEPDGPDPAAEADGDDQDRGQIVVTGQRKEIESPKATAKLVNTPRSVVLLPEQVIEQTGSTTLADALRTVPGITFGAAEGGNPIGDRPFIRGFDSQGSTFVDGVRDIAAQSREVFATQQVQIVRGSDSTLGGRGSAGGSINVITKLPMTGNFVSVNASAGTADYKRITLDANQQLTDLVGVRIAAVYHDQDFADRDATYSERWGVAPSFTIGLNGPTRLTVGYYYLESHELPDVGFPYLYTLANAPGTGEIFSEPAIGDVRTAAGTTGHVNRSAYYGLEDREFRDSVTHQATLRVEHDFGGVTLRNTSRYTYNDQAYIYTQPDDSQGNVFGTGQVWRRTNTRYGYTEALANQTDLFGTFSTGGIVHSFALGGELSWEKARRGAYVVNAGGAATTGPTGTPGARCSALGLARYNCTSLFNPNPSDPWVNYATDAANSPTVPITRGARSAETQNDAHTAAIYAFDSITLLPQLILNLGARYDHFESKVTPGLAAGATSTFSLSREDDLFNWQAGLVFKPTPNTSLYASYATSATPPNSLLGEGQEGNGLGTTNNAAALALLNSLEVEKTKSYEVGAKASLFDEQLSLTLAAFQTDTDNARVTGPDNTVEFIGKRRIRGVEFSFNGNVTEWLNLFGGYTHLDPKIVDGGYTVLTAPAVTAGGVTLQPARTVLVPSVNTGRQATQTARDSFTLWANLKPTTKLSIGGGAFYTSRVFGGYQDNRSATQNAAGVVTVNPATKVLIRTVPDYWRFDARIGYKLSENLELSVNVQNLTDETYFTQAYTSHYATIAPGRSAFATIGIKF